MALPTWRSTGSYRNRIRAHRRETNGAVSPTEEAGKLGKSIRTGSTRWEEEGEKKKNGKMEKEALLLISPSFTYFQVTT